MESVDITIIGAGVIGLAVASEIGREDRSVFVLEKNDSWGQETSSRNSEVIHAGIYYQPGSLKAISCIEGRDRLYALSKENRIPFKKTGKVIVAIEEKELTSLEGLRQKALKNGVELVFLDGREVQIMEPNVRCRAALYSTETGIIDSHALMEFFLKKARSRSVELALGAKVTGLQASGSEYRVEAENRGRKEIFLSRMVINCAGHNADKIAGLCGIDIKGQGYEQYFLKGNYFRLSDKFANFTRHLVYPVPLENSLGIHAVLDLRGSLRLGPDEEEVREIDYRVNENKKHEFYASVSKFLTGINEEALSPDISGIRPQLRRPNAGSFRDFIVSHEDKKGFPGLINLIGMESPGLTSSPYIARLVAGMVKDYLN